MGLQRVRHNLVTEYRKRALFNKHSLVVNGLDSVLGWFCHWLAGWTWASSLTSVALQSSSTDWGQLHEKAVWSSSGSIPVVSNAWWAPNECSLSYGWEHSMELSFPVSSWDREERQGSFLIFPRGKKPPSFLNLPCSWIKGTWTVIKQSINEHWQCSYGDLCEGEINGHTIYLLVGRPLILPELTQRLVTTGGKSLGKGHHQTVLSTKSLCRMVLARDHAHTSIFLS